MTAAWRRVTAALAVAGAGLVVYQPHASATQLICLNAQHQFVVCPEGTVPASLAPVGSSVTTTEPVTTVAPSQTSLPPSPTTVPAGGQSTPGAPPTSAGSSADLAHAPSNAAHTHVTATSGGGSSLEWPVATGIDAALVAGVSIALGVRLRHLRQRVTHHRFDRSRHILAP